MSMLNFSSKYGVAVLAAAVLIYSGACGKDQTESTAQATSGAPTVFAEAPVEAAEPVKMMEPAESPKPAEPAPKMQIAAESPKPVEIAKAPPSAKSEWDEDSPLTIADDSARKAMAENMIYATIRIKMEDMIEKRAELLKSGHHPTDVEVRQLEGSIMRARELLMEAGEIVEDVVPPIVEATPR